MSVTNQLGIRNNLTYKDCIREVNGILETFNVQRNKWQVPKCGKTNACGYYQISVLNYPYYYHRLMWEAKHGEIPANMEIDHINRNRADNSLDNLRLSTASQNHANSIPKRASKTSIWKGVHWRSHSNRWLATIRVNGKLLYLGRSKNEEEAALLYNAAATKYFGEFAYLNKISEK